MTFSLWVAAIFTVPCGRLMPGTCTDVTTWSSSSPRSIVKIAGVSFVLLLIRTRQMLPGCNSACRRGRIVISICPLVAIANLPDWLAMSGPEIAEDVLRLLKCQLYVPVSASCMPCGSSSACCQPRRVCSHAAKRSARIGLGEISVLA